MQSSDTTVAEGTTTTSATTDRPSVPAAEVRAWAKAQGIAVGSRGRINPEILARYVASL